MRTYLAGVVAVSVLTGWTFACTSPEIGRLSPPPSSSEPPDDPEKQVEAGEPQTEMDSGVGQTPAESLAAADCSQAFRCTARLARTQRGTLAKCTADVLGIVNDVLAKADVAITDDQLLACANKLLTAPCGTDTPECNFKGKRAVGMPCAISEQCQTAYCAWQGSGAACPVCSDPPAPTALANVNESCASATCAPGLGCRTSDKICTPFAKLGEDCSNAPCDYEGGFTCGKTTDTGNDLRCAPIVFSQQGGQCLYAPSGTSTPILCEGATCTTTASNTTGTCVAYLTKGSPCGSGPSCGRGLSCKAGTCQLSVPDTCK